MKIQQALAKFLIQLEADGRSHHTICQYQRHIRLFGHWARDVGLCRDVSAITHEDVARFLASPVARTRASGGIKKASSANALRSSLKGFFGYLHKAGFTAQDPSRLVRRAICGQPVPRALTNSEKDRLMDALLQGSGPAARRDHAMFHLMLATGIRLGSVIALDVEDVDLERKEIWIKAAKCNRPERVYLNKSISEHLREYMVDMLTGPVFIGRGGRRLSTRHIQRRFEMWLTRAGIDRPATPHSLRHTFATCLYEKTHDIFLVKEALRHRSILSTLVYAHGNESQLRAILQA